MITTDTVGRELEQAWAAFLVPHVESVRLATDCEDKRGVDLVVDGPGWVQQLQVKASVKGLRKHIGQTVGKQQYIPAVVGAPDGADPDDVKDALDLDGVFLASSVASDWEAAQMRDWVARLKARANP